ncbi:cAMP-binding domain of CRP or a regulatory subunit of cAMP-dependent protein kinases [Lishizhenia tianjinensis]|uniref:cAMP-binding domain of CRP or a regulatory subunit of cAMP-dependent protein kinases n=1 Tax=Lishizhenia tianjinensis TaxID=477690 RepID=A0A1I6YUR8_9FLAO|nr:Crp/Fnr family transcriptional regulator [Lishizhenia tianjinensis]SFT54253.1 cAMP-binding domain of CRP or a regulatory subunit of cAMP-dependent protein kinases [Lishizhenia tianjinensis]
MEEQLFQVFNAFSILSEEEISKVIADGKIKKLQKGEFFAKEGEVCNQVAVVVEGMFRSFYYNSNSEEITYCFRSENDFLSAYSSFLTGAPSTESFQALTAATYLCWDKSYIQELEKASINWVRFFKRLTELEYIEMEQRIFLLQKENAEQRYLKLREQNPHYLQRIPLNYLSSYLGITQRHLSRIRKEVLI